MLSGFDTHLGISVSVAEEEDSVPTAIENLRLATVPYELQQSFRQPLTPSFTLPGLVWRIVAKRDIVARSVPQTAADEFNSAGADLCANETFVIETTDDLSPYIGFSSGKSNMVWLEECCHGLGDRAGTAVADTQSALSVKAVAPRMLEVIGCYRFVPVEAGSPKMCLRTNLVPCQLAPSTVNSHGQTETSAARQPCSVELTKAKVSSIKGHPTLLYGLIGLSDGYVHVFSGDLDVQTSVSLL